MKILSQNDREILNCKICNGYAKGNQGLAMHIKHQHKNISFDEYRKQHLGYVQPLQGNIICKICNKKWHNLAQHIIRIHKIKPDDYFQKFGKTELIENRIKEKQLSGFREFNIRTKGLSPLKRLQSTLGIDNGKKYYEKWRENLKGIFTKKWYINKYGKDKGRELYIKRCDRICFTTSFKNNKIRNEQRWSKISQKLFWELYNELKSKNLTIYFGDLNHEYSCNVPRHNFDFVVLENKKVIEFNGNKFHPNPCMTEKQRKKWKQVYTNKNADEVDKCDKDKINAAIKNGFEFKIVYDSEYCKNKEKVKEECLSWINQ